MKKDASSEFDWQAAHQRLAKAASFSEALDLDSEALERIWKQRAQQMAQSPPQELAGERMDLALIRMGREIYGLLTDYVFDIRPAHMVTPVPRVPAWVAGVANLRGRIMSVIYLRAFLGLAEVNKDCGEKFLIVVHTDQMELAFQVDEVLGIENFRMDEILNRQHTADNIPGEYISGLIDSSSYGPVVVLNVPALLTDERIIIREDLL